MTRRQVLARFSLPFLAGLTTPARSDSELVEIVDEPHLLSKESAAGFKSLLPPVLPLRPSVVLLPGAKLVSTQRGRELREKVKNGSRLIWESGLAFASSSEIERQRCVLAEVFGLQLGDPIAESPNGAPYVAFGGAPELLVRPFGLAFPISGDRSKTIAHWGGTVVALRRRLGHGELVYLGAMLGPSLLASDPEARHAAGSLLRR
jgi:hypothetical protein